MSLQVAHRKAHRSPWGLEEKKRQEEVCLTISFVHLVSYLLWPDKFSRGVRTEKRKNRGCSRCHIVSVSGEVKVNNSASGGKLSFQVGMTARNLTQPGVPSAILHWPAGCPLPPPPALAGRHAPFSSEQSTAGQVRGECPTRYADQSGETILPAA